MSTAGERDEEVSVCHPSEVGAADGQGGTFEELVGPAGEEGGPSVETKVAQLQCLVEGDPWDPFVAFGESSCSSWGRNGMTGVDCLIHMRAGSSIVLLHLPPQEESHLHAYHPLSP